MKRLIFPILFYLFVYAPLPLFSLKYHDVRNTMEEILEYHIEYSELSPTLVKRSFKQMIDQFDPEKNYLLQGEIEPFLSMDDRSAKSVLKNYKKDKYPLYVELFTVFQKATERQRAYREAMMEEESIVLEKKTKYSRKFAKSPLELESRVRKSFARFASREAGKKKIPPEELKAIGNFWNQRLIEQESSYEIAEHQVSLHILKSLSNSLDSHTEYYSPTEAYEIRTSLQKQFSGVGVGIRQTYQGMMITHIYEGGPAARSNLVEEGDQIIEINGHKVADYSFEEASYMMKGKNGSFVELVLKREQSLISVSLRREEIIMNEERVSYQAEGYADGIIGKITVPSFYENGSGLTVENDIKEALKELKAQGKIKGLVLDFRENSGGFLTQAVKVSSLFISEGVIVISKYSDGEISYSRDFDLTQHYQGPLVILISKLSASAAEIVAQALQDYGVALIVGDERSFGKGSIQYQTITNNKAKYFYKVTVGKYYTASGRSPQVEGVKADVVVPTYLSVYHVGERYLEFPLPGDHLNGEEVSTLGQLQEGSYREKVKQVVPYLLPKESEWRKQLPILVKNSGERIKKNKNYQYFLDSIQGKKRKKKEKMPATFSNHRQANQFNYGEEDLQMKEAVDIVKDMGYLHEKKQAELEKVSFQLEKNAAEAMENEKLLHHEIQAISQ